MIEELENGDSLNAEETLDSNQEITEEVENEELLKAQEIAKNQRIRAEKAEAELKALKKPSAKENETNKVVVSNEDELYALIEAKVPKEDVKDVREAAKILGVTVVEALNNQIVKNILSQKAEERNSAQVANIGVNKRSINKDTDERLIEDFKQGKVSDKDEDIERLVKAQLAQRKKEAKGN